MKQNLFLLLALHLSTYYAQVYRFVKWQMTDEADKKIDSKVEKTD